MRPPSVLNGMRPPSAVSPASHQLLAVALGAEPEQLVVLELLVGEGVVAQRQVDVLGAEPGVLVGLPRGGRAVIVAGPTTGPRNVCPGE